MRDEEISHAVIGAAIAVHREIGPGMLESVYEACMTIELLERKLDFVRQHPVPLFYKGSLVDCGFKVDFLVERALVVELKAVERLDAVHAAQVISYLRATRCRFGLLINFNVKQLSQGVRRLVLDPR
jgi:GxxExxY protein